MNGSTATKLKVDYTNLADRSNQEIFDHVVDHLFTQKCPAREGTSCVMMDTDGHRCALGSLIDPETIKHTLATYDVTPKSGWGAWCSALGISLCDKWELLHELQSAHDAGGSHQSNELWLVMLYKRLMQTGRVFNLSTTALSKYKNEVFIGPYRHYDY